MDTQYLYTTVPQPAKFTYGHQTTNKTIKIYEVLTARNDTITLKMISVKQTETYMHRGRTKILYGKPDGKSPGPIRRPESCNTCCTGEFKRTAIRRQNAHIGSPVSPTLPHDILVMIFKRLSIETPVKAIKLHKDGRMIIDTSCDITPYVLDGWMPTVSETLYDEKRILQICRSWHHVYKAEFTKYPCMYDMTPHECTGAKYYTKGDEILREYIPDTITTFCKHHILTKMWCIL